MTEQIKSVSGRHFRVAIIGGNFAGISAARQLSSIRGIGLNQSVLDICVIDPCEQFTWTPNIHEVLSGVKTQKSVEIARPSLLEGLGIQFIHDEVTQLHQNDNNLVLKSGEKITYDTCLIACGFAAKVPSLAINNFQFRNAQDVSQIKQAIDRLHQEKDDIRVSIIGGGFSGVETLGELLRSVTNHNSSQSSGVKVTLIESSGQLVKNLPDVISKDIIKLCQSYPVEFAFERRVNEVEPGVLHLSDGSSIESDLNIWTTGGALPSFIQEAENRNDLAANAFLQYDSYSDCFIAGDAAGFQQNTQSLSKQSYHAIDMGKVAAENMLNFLHDRPLTEFSPTDKPTLLAFGNINTYMISGDTVVASPLLAATKEALYQVSMYKMTSPLSVYNRKSGLFARVSQSAQQLLIPELHPANLLSVLTRSRVLTLGSQKDLIPLLAGIRSILLDPL